MLLGNKFDSFEKSVYFSLNSATKNAHAFWVAELSVWVVYIKNQIFSANVKLLFWVSGTPGADNQVPSWCLIRALFLKSGSLLLMAVGKTAGQTF